METNARAVSRIKITANKPPKQRKNTTLQSLTTKTKTHSINNAQTQP